MERIKYTLKRFLTQHVTQMYKQMNEKHKQQDVILDSVDQLYHLNRWKKHIHTELYHVFRAESSGRKPN